MPKQTKRAVRGCKMKMTMVERAARAIDRSCWAVPDNDYPAEKARREAKQFSAISSARAAIKAMREPTEKMSDEGAANNYGKPSYAAYQAMIDAALNETR